MNVLSAHLLPEPMSSLKSREAEKEKSFEPLSSFSEPGGLMRVRQRQQFALRSNEASCTNDQACSPRSDQPWPVVVVTCTPFASKHCLSSLAAPNSARTVTAPKKIPVRLLFRGEIRCFCALQRETNDEVEICSDMEVKCTT